MPSIRVRGVWRVWRVAVSLRIGFLTSSSQSCFVFFKCLFFICLGNLWTRLGSAPKTQEKTPEKAENSVASPEEDDSELQRVWGALIKEKEQSRQKKSRLDHLPSLQIEISRESSSGSDSESWLVPQPHPQVVTAAWQDPLCPKAGHWHRLCRGGSRSVSAPFLQRERHKPLET